jgi:hypothetical protein
MEIKMKIHTSSIPPSLIRLRRTNFTFKLIALGNSHWSDLFRNIVENEAFAKKTEKDPVHQVDS